MNFTVLFREPATPVPERFAELAARRSELVAQRATASHAEREDHAALDSARVVLREAEGRHLAFGDAEDQVKAGPRQVSTLEKRVDRHHDERDRADDAIRAVEAEFARHAREHAGELWDEVMREAAALRDGQVEHLRALAGSRAAWRDLIGRSTALLRMLDPDALGASEHPVLPPAVERLARDVEAVVDELPLALPQTQRSPAFPQTPARA